MKITLLFSVIVVAFVACSPAKDKAAMAALDNYKHFVDSIYSQNEVWKTTSDTIYEETPNDPNDPSKTIVNTIVTPPESKESLVLDKFWGNQIKTTYEVLKLDIENNITKMDDGMKKEYEASKQKFESLNAK